MKLRWEILQQKHADYDTIGIYCEADVIDGKVSSKSDTIRLLGKIKNE